MATAQLGDVNGVLGLNFVPGSAVEQSTGGEIVRSAGNSIVFSQDAIVGGAFNLTAGNSITFSDSASGQAPKTLTANNSVTFGQSGQRNFSVSLSAGNSVVFSDIARNGVFALSASNSVVFVQENRYAVIYELTGSSEITFQQTASPGAFNLSASDSLAFFQTNNRIRVGEGFDRDGSSVITFTQANNRTRVLTTATPLSGSNTLTFVDRALIPIEVTAANSIEFTVLADRKPQPSAKHTLVFTQQAIAAKVKGFSASNTLSLNQSVIWTHVRGGKIITPTGPCRIDQSYSLGTPPTLTKLDNVQFFWPAGPINDATKTLILRAPNFSNRDRLVKNRINRETRGGTLKIFRDPKWPEQQTVVADFSGIKESEVDSIMEFFRDTQGVLVGLRDWENRIWYGIVMSTTAPLIQNGRNLIDFTVEMDLDELVGV